jgi:hypothetical protein
MEDKEIPPYQDMTLREWQLYYKDISKLIVQASSKDKLDTWQPFPIGMQYNYLYHYNKGFLIQIGPHNKTVLCAINEKTDQTRRSNKLNRKLILSNLSKNNINFTPFLI